MRINYTETYISDLIRQLNYISEDKPQAAKKFRKELKLKIQELTKAPLKCRKSIYSDQDNIRDLVFKGYTIT